MHYEQQDADRPHELHDLGKAPKIVFVLHDGKFRQAKITANALKSVLQKEMSPWDTFRHSPAVTIGIFFKYHALPQAEFGKGFSFRYAIIVK